MENIDDIIRESKMLIGEANAPRVPAPPGSEPPYGEPSGKPPKKRKKRGWLIALIIVVVLALAAIIAYKFMFDQPIRDLGGLGEIFNPGEQQPDAPADEPEAPGADETPEPSGDANEGEKPTSVTSGLGARKDGFSTVLLCGTDEGGYRTDTIILAAMDSRANTVSLLSIPRDTYVYGGYSVAKINSALGAGGMDELMEAVKGVVGFYPDGYVMVNLESFAEIVDVMGGVQFDVPRDMYYNDPAQSLYIDLKAGTQTLDGEHALQLVRYRSGYSNADIGRGEVQRDFLKAAASQWAKLSNMSKLPKIISVLNENAETDLTRENILWLAKELLSCDLGGMVTESLPGYGATISGGSYYILDVDASLALVNEYFNPYENDVTREDANIRQ